MMILVRNVFQSKYGKGGELVALFKEIRQQQPAMSVDRILTDASGPFFTVVTETMVESLADWEQSPTSLATIDQVLPHLRLAKAKVASLLL